MGVENGNGLTQTEKRLHGVLSDRMPHSYAELLKCLNDDLADVSLLWVHVSNLRSKLADRGEVIAPMLAGQSRGYIMLQRQISGVK